MEQFRFKQSDELKEQVKSSESTLDKELPQPSAREEILRMSVKEINP